VRWALASPSFDVRLPTTTWLTGFTDTKMSPRRGKGKERLPCGSTGGV
jgi:hypothetical protein